MLKVFGMREVVIWEAAVYGVVEQHEQGEVLCNLNSLSDINAVDKTIETPATKTLRTAKSPDLVQTSETT